jgi:hypothetical protein
VLQALKENGRDRKKDERLKAILLLFLRVCGKGRKKVREKQTGCVVCCDCKGALCFAAVSAITD